MVAGLCVVGFKLNRQAIRGNRFVEVPLLHQRIAEIVVDCCVLGFQLERSSIGSDGRVELTLVFEGVAKIIVGLRQILAEVPVPGDSW